MSTDQMIFVAVVALRFLIPLLIPRFPLPAILAALVIDAADQTIFQNYTDLDLTGYQGYDKALDIYYLTIAYLSTLRNWTDPFAFSVGRFLWYYRLLGVLLFELFDVRALLIIFPNTFEYFFIAYEVVRLWWNPERLTRRQVIGLAAFIWVFIKLPQEWWIHIAQTRRHRLHEGGRVRRAGRVVLGHGDRGEPLVRRTDRRGRYRHRLRGQRDRSAGTEARLVVQHGCRQDRWPDRTRRTRRPAAGDHQLVHVRKDRPGHDGDDHLRSAPPGQRQQHHRNDRGGVLRHHRQLLRRLLVRPTRRSWATSSGEFAAMAVVNLAGSALVFIAVARNSDEPLNEAATVFFVLLLTLIVTMFDRYHRSVPHVMAGPESVAESAAAPRGIRSTG